MSGKVSLQVGVRKLKSFIFADSASPPRRQEVRWSAGREGWELRRGPKVWSCS